MPVCPWPGNRPPILRRGSDFKIKVTGSGHNPFNICLITERNHQLQRNDQSLGYIYEFSRANFASAYINSGHSPAINIPVGNIERRNIIASMLSVTPHVSDPETPWSAIALMVMMLCRRYHTFIVVRDLTSAKYAAAPLIMAFDAPPRWAALWAGRRGR